MPSTELPFSCLIAKAMAQFHTVVIYINTHNHFVVYTGFICIPTADFADVVQKTELHSKIPFSLDGTFIKRYFGDVRERKHVY